MLVVGCCGCDVGWAGSWCWRERERAWGKVWLLRCFFRGVEVVMVNGENVGCWKMVIFDWAGCVGGGDVCGGGVSAGFGLILVGSLFCFCLFLFFAFLDF